MRTLLQPYKFTMPVPNTVPRYFFTTSNLTTSTSSTLVNGALRLAPWLLETKLSIDRITAEISSAGEAGSKLRLGIYADNGRSYPGALLLDAGQIAGDSATVQELTCALTLAPGLYWVGGVVQNTVTTQPTVRIINNWTVQQPLIGTVTSIPSAGFVSFGFAQTGVTAALPSTFTQSPTGVGAGVPRVAVRIA